MNLAKCGCEWLLLAVFIILKTVDIAERELIEMVEIARGLNETH